MSKDSNSPNISENTSDLANNDLNTRKSFTNLGITFSGWNLKDLAKDHEPVNDDKKYPIYQYKFEFIGFKYSMVEKENKILNSIVFLSPDGIQFSTFGQVILDEMKVFEASEYISKDETGKIRMENGFILTTEVIQPVYTYYENRGEYGGYSKLN